MAALQVLAIMIASGKPLSELAARAMERVPQVLENVTLSAKKPLEEMRALSSSAKISKELGDDGRVLVRWSGTEAKFDHARGARREDHIKAWAKELAGAARTDIP